MMAKLALGFLMVCAVPALAQTPKAAPAPAAAAAIDQASLVQRYGKVLERRPVGIGGLTAWTVEKNGRRVVLYTTADGQAIFSGVVWDAYSGRNLSDQFVPAGTKPAAAPAVPAAPATLAANAALPIRSGPMTAPPLGALVGKFGGPVPESIKTIASLEGVKEGSGGPADTLYVVFDPRCPYCRKAYNNLRPYVQKGYSVKWIPVVALANPEQGVPVTASVLQAGSKDQAEVLRRVLGNKEELKTAPSKATLLALDRNLAFFYAAFKNNNVDNVGVPAAFFLDKRTGSPRMMTGIQEMPVIEEVFGTLP